MTYPATADELFRRHAEAALELSGAGQTAWNSRILQLTSGQLAVALWDGSLALDGPEVLAPIEEMYGAAGARHDPATLVRYRDALATLLHEQSHFLGPAGATQADARAAFNRPGALELEEGVAEAWAQDNLNAYLHLLGIDQVAPGITAVPSTQSYPQYTPAVRELVAGLATDTGRSPPDVLTELSNQTAEGQWPLVAHLSGLVPGTAAEDTMRQEFARLTAVTGVNESRAIGRQALAEARQAVAGARQPGTEAGRAVTGGRVRASATTRVEANGRSWS
ncbi:hypothetical protein [Kribbella deserti]|uniref:Uncharacterized protein n=1 Tax=Kribbella deserti TaxID=1926257 RepID=A0ABV6QKA5_9ACTN